MALAGNHIRRILLAAMLCSVAFLAAFIAVPQHAQAEEETHPYGTVAGCTWKLDAQGRLTIAPDPQGDGTIDTNGIWPWHDYRTMIKEVVFEKGVVARNNRHQNQALLVNMFMDCRNLKSIDFSDFDTTEVSNMCAMFENCSSLTRLDLSGFNTPNLTNVQLMFNNCTSLTYLDISNFDTTHVDTASTDTPSVEYPDYYGVFGGCTALTTIKIGSNFTLSNQLFGSFWKNEENDKTYDFSDDHYTSFGKGEAGTYTRDPASDDAGPKPNPTIGEGDKDTDEQAGVPKANKITKAVTSKTVKYSKVKKKAQTFKIGAKVKGKAKVTYKVTKRLKKGKITAKKVKKWIKVSKAGKVTILKGAPKGTYKLKVKITAAATKVYKKTSVTKTITIKVK